MDRSLINERNKASVTIGLNATGTYSTLDQANTGGMGEQMADEKAAINNEFKNAKDALKATG